MSKSAENTISPGAKKEGTSTVPRTGRRGFARQVSLCEEDPSHIEKLRETLETFPLYDLRAREDLQETPEVKGIAGRTCKKPVLLNREFYLLKKNAREASMEEGHKKTPSEDMDLEVNHEESFREICAMRLFQLMWGRRGAAPDDAKIILSDFNLAKPQNLSKANMTKVYFASKQVQDIPFNIARLSVINREILEEENEDGSFKNQHLIDQLCEQILIQCLLSNPDAIKFDNFFAGKNPIVHFDFGDARNNEYSSPDPLCIIDSIRKHVDANSTKSIRGTFTAENPVYMQAIKFFQKHISANHILAVISRLQEISEEDLWQVAYVYTYGNKEEKKSYADCFIARIRNFTELKILMEQVGGDENFSSKSIRGMLINNPEYQESKINTDIFLEIDSMFQKIQEISESSHIDFAEDEKKSAASDSESSESDEESAAEVLLQEMKAFRNSIYGLCDEMRERASTPIDRQENLPEDDSEDSPKRPSARGGADKKLQSEISDSELDKLKDTIYKFCKNVELYQKIEHSPADKERFDEYIANERSKINNLTFSFLTHHDSYQTLQNVQGVGYFYSEERGEKLKKKFAELGINVSPEKSEYLDKNLARIASRSSSQAQVTL